jgi:SWI/SNF-related matrix-associated actin-dependent regulator 1 of chromatin subfamily A
MAIQTVKINDAEKTVSGWGLSRLTFEHGNFILQQSGARRTTLDLKGALRFRRNADEKAKKVFKRSLNRMYDAPSQKLPIFLDTHQKDGVHWILTRRRSYLAHAPGAGKTAQAIVASLMAHGHGQTVFIVPPTLTVNWAREVLKWTEWADFWPSITIIPTSDKQNEVDWRSDFIVVPDSMLTKPWVYDHLQLLPIKLLAVDEASRFKEQASERTKALFGGQNGPRLYSGLIGKARHTVLLDGSPMPNRPMELWAPTIAMDPEAIDCMTMHEFGVKYCAGRFIADKFKLDWDYRGASNQFNLRLRLQERFMHVVGENELHHPERLRSILFMNENALTTKAFEQKYVSRINLNDLNEEKSQGDLAKLRHQIGISKIDWVVNYVKERHDDKNEALLIFAWHREVCWEIANRLKSYRPGLVMGGVPQKEREKILDAFQSGATRIIVGNIHAMGRGVNLQRANRVIFAEYSWSDELNRQCEKRASRKGSAQNSVRCDYVVVPNSIDETVLNAVFTKAKNVKEVIG